MASQNNLLDRKVQGLDASNCQESKTKGVQEWHWYQSFVEPQPLIGDDSANYGEREDKTLVGVKQSGWETRVVAQFAIEEQRHRRWKIPSMIFFSFQSHFTLTSNSTTGVTLEKYAA